MAMSYRDRGRAITMALVFIGAAVVTALSMRAAQGRMWHPVVALATITVVVAGLEVASIRRGAARAPVGAWLPAALGIATAARQLTAQEPRGPDAGVADSLMIAAVVVVAIVLAVVVNAAAALASRSRRSPRT
jgi:lysylphosphatidylglycerol synthetase-like protein (DUF2156 family)